MNNKHLIDEIKKKIKRYENITIQAIKEIKFSENLTEKERKIAEIFLRMAKDYFNDAKYFKEKNDYLNSLAALSYAHAWLDAGVKAQYFETKNDNLFTLP